MGVFIKIEETTVVRKIGFFQGLLVTHYLLLITCCLPAGLLTYLPNLPTFLPTYTTSHLPHTTLQQQAPINA